MILVFVVFFLMNRRHPNTTRTYKLLPYPTIGRSLSADSIDRSRGLTGMTGPSKPPSNRLRARTAPTERGRRLAPISATDRGLKRKSRLRKLMVPPAVVSGSRSFLHLGWGRRMGTPGEDRKSVG